MVPKVLIIMKIVYTQNQTEPLLQKSLKRAAPLRSIEIALLTHIRSLVRPDIFWLKVKK